MAITIIEHDAYYEDRGEIFAFYDKRTGAHDNIEFVQDRCSISYKGGVRGFHGDPETWKYITCPIGSIQLVIWDIKNRSTERVFLNEYDKRSVLIPPNHLNAHQCLSHTCLFLYKQTEYYDKFPAEKQWSVHYNDPTITPKWVVTPRRISKRDKTAMFLEEFYDKWTDN